MRRALYALLVVLAVLVDGFFAVVNFYPVAPARKRGARREVLIALEPAAAKWLQENLVAEFNEEHNVDVELRNVDEEELYDTLAAESAKPSSTLMLASLPRARDARRAVASHLVRGFDEVVPSAQIASDLGAVAPRLMKAATLDGKQTFLPHLARVDVLVYRLSRVRDAARHWSLLRADIDAALRAANGWGLPPGYTLELDPELWDGDDRFVIGYYWAHRRYGGQPARGRIAHRIGARLDGVVDIAEGVYRAGAGDATIAKLDGDPALDYFRWEALYRRHGLYTDEMFRDRPYGDDEILDGLRRNELYLATVDQMEAFTLHGGSHRAAPPRVDDPDDLGFAPLPRISSLDVDARGKPLRAGQPFSFREDWVWALPTHGADANLAYALVTFLWAREQHYRACEAMGELPARSDVVRERASLFRLRWMDDVLDACFAEWERAQPVPDTVGEGVGARYAALWDRLIAERAAVDQSATGVRALLATPPPARAVAQAGAAPPSSSGAASPSATASAPSSDDTDDDDDATDDSAADIDTELWRGQVAFDRDRKVEP